MAGEELPIWDIGNKIASYGVMGGFGAYALHWIMRMFSARSRKTIARDRAEEDLVKTLQYERDQANTRAELAYKARDEALKRELIAIQNFSRLEGEVKGLREQVLQLTQRLEQREETWAESSRSPSSSS